MSLRVSRLLHIVPPSLSLQAYELLGWLDDVVCAMAWHGAPECRSQSWCIRTFGDSGASPANSCHGHRSSDTPCGTARVVGATHIHVQRQSTDAFCTLVGHRWSCEGEGSCNPRVWVEMARADSV